MWGFSGLSTRAEVPYLDSGQSKMMHLRRTPKADATSHFLFILYLPASTGKTGLLSVISVIL